MEAVISKWHEHFKNLLKARDNNEVDTHDMLPTIYCKGEG